MWNLPHVLTSFLFNDQSYSSAASSSSSQRDDSEDDSCGEVPGLEESVFLAQETVQKLRFMQVDAELALPGLPGALVDLSAGYAGLGKRTEALEASTEAVALFRSNSMNQYLPNALVNLSRNLCDIGRDDEAVQSLQEALTIQQNLYPETSPLHTNGLASILLQLAFLYSKLNRWKSALEPCEGSVRLLRDRPDKTSRSQLVDSLDCLADILDKWGRRNDAVKASNEAVSLVRDLEKQYPTEFLQTFSICRLRQLERVVHGTDETLSQIDQLTAQLTYPVAVLGCKLSRCNCLLRMRRRNEGIEAAEESMLIYEKLPVGLANEFSVICAQNLAEAYRRAGRRDEALGAVETALDALERLDQSPERGKDDLATLLGIRSRSLAGVGRREEAVAAAERALGMWKDMSIENEEVYKENVAQSLHDLSNRFAELHRNDEALTAIQNAIPLYRALVAGECSELFQIPLAQALSDFSSRLGDAGRNDEALAAAEESAASLFSSATAMGREAYAECLTRLSLLLFALGRVEEAVLKAQQSVDLTSGFADECPAAFNHLLANSLDALYTCSGNQNMLQKAIALRRPLAAQWPMVFGEDLARSLEQLSSIKP
ncbi:hypothetical protein C8J56DRAFT_970784 [Mycena floridula]|nr:hypothetical protein C8J56DRAFT_970784 [Mycena floridula]